MQYKINIRKCLFGNQNVNDQDLEKLLDQIDFQLSVFFNTLMELKLFGTVNDVGFELIYDNMMASFRSEVLEQFKR